MIKGIYLPLSCQGINFMINPENTTDASGMLACGQVRILCTEGL